MKYSRQVICTSTEYSVQYRHMSITASGIFDSAPRKKQTAYHGYSVLRRT